MMKKRNTAVSARSQRYKLRRTSKELEETKNLNMDLSERLEDALKDLETAKNLNNSFIGHLNVLSFLQSLKEYEYAEQQKVVEAQQQKIADQTQVIQTLRDEISTLIVRQERADTPSSPSTPLGLFFSLNTPTIGMELEIQHKVTDGLSSENDGYSRISTPSFELHVETQQSATHNVAKSSSSELQLGTQQEAPALESAEGLELPNRNGPRL